MKSPHPEYFLPFSSSCIRAALGIAEPIPNRTIGEDKGIEGSSPAASHLVSKNDSWDDDDDGLNDLSPEALANLERLALGLPAL